MTTVIINKLKDALEAEFIDKKSIGNNIAQLIDKEGILVEINQQIEEVIPVEKFENDYNATQEYHENILMCKLNAQRCHQKNAKTENNENEGQSAYVPESVVPEVSVNLPRLEIGKFYGDPALWIEFWEQYKSTIHENKSLSAVNKFSYLKSYLGGNAASAIAGLTLSENNYHSAIKILNERFGKRDIVIGTHMNKLMSLWPVKRLHDTYGLRKLYDKIEVQIRSLESLDVISETYGQLLCPMILKLIPNELVLEFNKTRENEEIWNVNEIMKFIRKEIDGREKANAICGTAESKHNSPNFKNFGNNRFDRVQGNKFKGNKFVPSATELVTTAENKKCLFCDKEDHRSEECENISVNDKKQKLREKGRCFLCLQTKHLVKTCVRRERCKYCERKHNSTICPLKTERKSQSEDVNDINHKTSNAATANSAVNTIAYPPSVPLQGEIFLQTVSAKIVNGNCNKIIRCLFDSGSQRTFIRRDIVECLNLKIVGNERLIVHSFASNSPIEKIYRRIKLKIKSTVDNSELEIEALETDTISNANIIIPNENVRTHLKDLGLELTDLRIKNTTQNTQISLLIGSEYYWKFVTGKIKRFDTSLVAIETRLGWCIQGQVNELNLNNDISINLVVEESLISQQLRGFWELENLGIKENEIDVENSNQEILNEFNSTIKFINGRYKVKLPWKQTFKETLADNKEIATIRLNQLVKKFKNNMPLFERYQAVLQDYLDEGIIENIPLEGNQNNTIYYIPHHAVLNENKSTNLRIVYDASSHSDGNISLNDCLHSGPNLNPELLELLIKFRENKIAYTADIKQAFLQISLDEQDRDVARFLWNENPFANEELREIKTLRLTRVLFGVTSSPFLLAAILKYHFQKYANLYPRTYKILNESFYVDDLIGGCENIEDALQISLESIKIMKEAGMHLRKWQTNSKELEGKWKELNVEINNSSNFVAQRATSSKILGIAWNINEDNFFFDPTKLLTFLEKQNNTKRFVLQVAGRIFDPVGFFSPFILRIKCLLQEIWCSGIGWDEKLPDHLVKKWKLWCDEIKEFDKLNINRYYMKDVDKEEVPVCFELHSFCDASIKAYGTVLYLRIVTNSGNIYTSFVSSKTRVAPLKTITLPRLELMGALLAARLSNKISSYLKYSLNHFFWTDSTVALCWIKSIPNKFKPFVQHRVEEIQNLTEPIQWYHCPGKENPADLLSRGATILDLKSNELWWHGPQWLRMSKEWPIQPEGIHVSEFANAELRSKFKEISQCNLNVVKTEKLLNIEKYSSLLRILRITAWINRFIFNARNTEKKVGALSTEELQNAEMFWIKCIQEDYYNAEISSLRTNKNVNKDSSIYDLTPYLDEDNIMRVGGRLSSSGLPENANHPIILPKNSKFTELIIEAEHCKVMHGRVTRTLAHIRNKYWIPKGRQQVKKILNKCLVCKRYSAKPATQITAPLPEDRIHETPPFYVSGIDFAGPIYIKGKTEYKKTYIALFTCAVTRAVHLELVSDMTTDKFLLALRRFIARRGKCHTIYSDNAKTFKSAEKELSEICKILRKENIQDFIAKTGIHWKYIVERAAWWGGFYERMVKSVKTCLKKVLGKASLNFEELATLLAEIESVINLRPLTYCYDDVNEPEVLTPAHFLSSKPQILIPPLDPKIFINSSNKVELTKRKVYRQRLFANLWKRWKGEYLMNLRSAFHLTHPQKKEDLKVGDIVLLEDTYKSKLLWDLGTITEIYRGRDGHVRSCKVRTQRGLSLRRPIQMFYPLELGQPDGAN